MIIRGYEIGAKLIAYIVGGLVLVAVIAFTMHSCDVRRSKAAQTRVERAQGTAQANSAADAVNTITRSGEEQAASEQQTRKNEEDIRNAKGSNAAIDPAARDAGITALCKRRAYANDPRCKGAKS